MSPQTITKTGIMLGLGEDKEEIVELLHDAAETLGIINTPDAACVSGAGDPIVHPAASSSILGHPEIRVVKSDENTVTATGGGGRTATTTFTDASLDVAAAPAGVTFALTYQGYSDSTCSTTVGGSNGSPQTTSVTAGTNFALSGSPAYWKLTAGAASAPAGATFSSWTKSGVGSAFSSISANVICALAPTGSQGFIYTANYTTIQNQTITVTTHAPSTAAFNSTFVVAATASSGLAVSYSSAGSCSNSGTTFTMTSGTGTCTVNYNQAGNASFNAAPQVTESVTASKASQTITFGALAAKTYGDPSFSVSATASSGLVVGFGASGNCTIATTTVTITGAGSCTITASQAGDVNYLAAPNVPQTFSIAKAAQVITFNPLPDKTTSDPPFTVSATASSGLAASFSATGNCTVSGNTVTITGAGACTITALQPGNINYNPAPDLSRTFTITSGGGSGPSVAFVGIDSTTQGSWNGVYGGDGYNVVNDLASYPSYAVVTPSGQGSYTWLTSTSDVRALQKGSNPADRLAATWYGSPFSIDLNLTDGNTHQVGLYVVDWDSTNRTQTLEVRDAATDALLDSRSASGFHNGQYVIWNIRGHVTVRVISTAGVNAVVSGLFFGGSAPPPNPTASAAFVGLDATTQGSWQGVYGSDGYNVIDDSISYPAYAQVAPSGQSSYTWAATTTDVRALQKASAADRLAATWYGLTFTIDLNVVDGLTHRFALYMIDWDSTTRTQTIEVRDAVTNALLDTRAVSGFHDGRYLVWNIRGHVIVRIVNTGGVNAVVSGLFFGS
jgi:hypothetical protein